MAHQWFGDMVTMQWWDNLWLNEGFATWMESKPVAKWHPEWNIPQDDAQSLDTTLNYDAGKITRTIRATADTPAQINEQFDGIACRDRVHGSAADCRVFMRRLGATRKPSWDDRPPPGRWAYRVTMSANWLDDPTLGDALMVSVPVEVTVPG